MTTSAASISVVLRRLQSVDLQIREVRGRIGSFDPQLAEVDATVQQLGADAETTSGRVEELRTEERRLQRTSSDMQARLKKLRERAKVVRTVREEAAVQAETGHVRRVLDSEEQERINLLDQVKRLEDRLASQQTALEEGKSAAEPRRRELVAERDAAHEELAALEDRREGFAAGIDSRYMRVYDNLIRSGRKAAVAPMAEDGACGACFSVIPLQLQNEIRTSAPLVICEACGVIVTAPEETDQGDPEPSPAET